MNNGRRERGVVKESSLQVISVSKDFVTMGYRDTEQPSPVELFTRFAQPCEDSVQLLRHRLSGGQGRPIYRLDQLELLYEDLYQEPSVQLEYDSFLPIRVQHPR
jgi:hypothetical protein